MIVTVSPSVINGTVMAPGGKSTMQRACALALLNNGSTTIENAGTSNDDLAALLIIQQAGAVVENTADSIIVKSDGSINIKDTVHCGESGLSLRMFTPILAICDTTVEIQGEGSLLRRPISFFDTVLPLVNVKVKTNNGFLPLTIKGPLTPRDVTIDSPMSSQYITGLLFAFAKSAVSETVISVQHLASKPYIDLSLRMLAHFGYSVSNDEYIRFTIPKRHEEKRDITYYNEGDWSGSSFLLVAGAIAGSITVKGLLQDSAQADKAIMQVLALCNAAVSIDENDITVTNTNDLTAFTFDATDCPDLFPPLVALAACCKGTSVITGTSRLVAKESNRALSLTDVFSRMGIEISVDGNQMTIVGGKIRTATVDGHHDHRIVMACAIAGLKASGDVVIQGAEAVKKSYPAFFDHLTMVGAGVSLD